MFLEVWKTGESIKVSVGGKRLEKQRLDSSKEEGPRTPQKVSTVNGERYLRTYKIVTFVEKVGSTYYSTLWLRDG